MAYPHVNLLIEALPPELRGRLLQQLQPMDLPMGHPLFEAGVPPRYVHFMTSGIASRVISLASGDEIETGLVGREGFPEVMQVLGPRAALTRCFMQVGGTGLRMDFRRFQELLAQEPVLMRLVLELAQQDALEMAQLSACNGLHEVEERLARWLLMVQDRTGETELRLTQEFLGQMLGARRSTVNIAAGTLQRSGLIEFRRSLVRIEDRERLEAVACECYPVVRDLVGNLYRDANRGRGGNGSGERNRGREATRTR